MKRLLLLVLLAACSGRTAYQRYPGAPAVFERAASDAKAVEIADKVFAAAGGHGNWDKAKQIRWRQTITADGKQIVDVSHIWDRWNGRHLGRLHRTDGTDLVVGYDLYGSFSMGYVQQPGEKEKKTNLDEAGRNTGLKIAKEAFNEHTAVMTMQFLMLEPGTKLAYVGPQNDEGGKDNWDELKVTFADPLRQDLEFHPVVDRGFVARHNRTTNPLIFRISDYRDALVSTVAFNKITRTVRATVIDNVNPTNLWAKLTDHAKNVITDLVAWYHCCNFGFYIHHVISGRFQMSSDIPAQW